MRREPGKAWRAFRLGSKSELHKGEIEERPGGTL